MLYQTVLFHKVSGGETLSWLWDSLAGWKGYLLPARATSVVPVPFVTSRRAPDQNYAFKLIISENQSKEKMTAVLIDRLETSLLSGCVVST